MKKKIVLILICFTILSCKKEINQPESKPEKVSLEMGKQLFQEKNCITCHQTNQKVVGPSLEQIATIYKKQNVDLKNFLKATSEPIVDPSQYEIMKINLELTKVMSDAELKSLEMYILSFSK